MEEKGIGGEESKVDGEGQEGEKRKRKAKEGGGEGQEGKVDQ